MSTTRVSGGSASLASRGGRSAASGEAGDGLGGGERAVGREEEGAEARRRRSRRAGGAGGQRERVDADDAEAAVGRAEVALEDGRDLPAGAAEGDVVGERAAAGRSSA